MKSPLMEDNVSIEIYRDIAAIIFGLVLLLFSQKIGEKTAVQQESKKDEYRSQSAKGAGIGLIIVGIIALLQDLFK